MSCLTKKYSVDYSGNKPFLKNAKDKYKENEEVVLYFDLIATDTRYTFLLDGKELNVDYSNDKGFIIKFIMPDHDVKLEIKHQNLMIE